MKIQVVCERPASEPEGFDTPDRKRWARHGSTRWLHGRDSVTAAIRYVVEKQGEAMAVFV